MQPVGVEPLSIRAGLTGQSLDEQECSMSVNQEAANRAGPGSAVPDPRRWRALGLLAIADFVVILDATIVNVALPSIGRGLHASTSDLSWVTSAYILAFGGLLMLGGRLADLFGRRRLFIGGLVLFGLASLAGGLSTSIGELIAFRALQGAGAAMLAPAARSIVVTLFEEGPERSRALGIWAAVAGSGSVVGLILGGVLTSSLGWRWVLFINVPITLGAAALAPVLIRESRAETTDRSIDYAGAALVTGGLVAILYALVNAGSAGWGSAETIGLLGLGAVLLAVFTWVEGKVRSPLAPLRIFRVGQVRGANIAMLMLASAMVGFFFILALYLQDVLGYSAVKAGMASVPLGAILIIVAGGSSPVAERLGAKPVLLSGLAVFTGGVAWMTRISTHSDYLTGILGPSLLIGAGLGLAFIALTIASVSGIEAEHSGVAGGLINMTQQVGGAIGLAVITALITTHVHRYGTSLDSFTRGLRDALTAAAIIGAASLAVSAIALPRRNPNAPTTKTAETKETAQVPAHDPA
jgi:EmrB/QacA subfamily drug resistance transporter